MNKYNYCNKELNKKKISKKAKENIVKIKDDVIRNNIIK